MTGPPLRYRGLERALRYAHPDPPGTLRQAIEAALDALESGDVYGAEQVLARSLDGPRRARRHRCPCCGIGFEWPGQLDDHLAMVHPGVAAA